MISLKGPKILSPAARALLLTTQSAKVRKHFIKPLVFFELHRGHQRLKRSHSPSRSTSQRSPGYAIYIDPIKTHLARSSSPPRVYIYSLYCTARAAMSRRVEASVRSYNTSFPQRSKKPISRAHSRGGPHRDGLSSAEFQKLHSMMN